MSLTTTDGDLAVNGKQEDRRLQSLESDFEIIGLGKFAERLGVCANTVRNLIGCGKLVNGEHYMRIGRTYRFPWSYAHVDKVMRALGPEPAPTRPKMQGSRPNKCRLKYIA